MFFVHLAWATILGLLTLCLLRFYPTSFGGFLFTGLVTIALITLIVIYTNFGHWVMIKMGLAPSAPEPISIVESTITPLAIPSGTSSPESERETPVIAAPSITASRTPRPSSTPATLPATETPTSTVTAEPTPIIAVIRASEGGGAFIREQPGGQALITLANGATVTIIPDDFQDVNGVIWIHVFASIDDRRVEGWILQSLLQTATPFADWQPSPTP